MPAGVFMGKHLLLILLYLSGDPSGLFLADEEEISRLQQVRIDDSAVAAYRLGNATIKGKLRSFYIYILMFEILAQRAPPDARSQLGGHGLPRSQSSPARQVSEPENRYPRSKSCARKLHPPQPR